MTTRKLLMQNPAAVVGSLLLFLMILLAVVGPVVRGVDPNSIDISHRFASFTAQHPLGTDDLGRDTFSRLLNGGRTSLTIALAASAIGTLGGVIVGMTAGFVGGWVDLVVMRVDDLLFAIPTLLIAIGIVALGGPSAGTTIVALGIAYMPFYARLVRGAVVGIKSRPYVDASRAVGSSGFRLVRTEVLPGVIPLALVQSAALVGYALVDEASLGFLGLGVQPPAASWGAMINAGRQFITEAPWLTLLPGVMVIITVFGINLISDALRDVLDPRRSQRAVRASQ